MPRLLGSVYAVAICAIHAFFIQAIFAEGNFQPPRFIGEHSASHSVVNENHTKILQCQALGYPQPLFRWNKDGIGLGDFSPEAFYKISSVRKEDAGDYRCIAKNSAGTILSVKNTVFVAYMTNGEESKEEMQLSVQSGDAAILALPHFESYPPPSVTWQTSDNTLLYGIKYAITDPQNNLIILQTSSLDAKTYRARITNTQLGKEILSPKIRLKIEGEDMEEDIPPSIIVMPSNVTIVKGTSIAQLQCIANARPLYHLETLWFKDGVPIEHAGLVFSFNGLWNRTLSLLQATLEYAGEYRCQVRLKTSVDEPQVALAYVTIHERPFVRQFPVETLADLGKHLTLDCRVKGVPSPELAWYKDAVDIEDYGHSRFRVLANGSLTISSVHVGDSGMFQCIASNPAGESSSYTWLKVKMPDSALPNRVARSSWNGVNMRYTSVPVILKSPENSSVLDSQDATFECEAGGAPHPNMTWLFKGQKLSDGNRYRISSNGLLIRGVRAEDEGEYRCIRANEAGSVEASAQLLVLVKTQISQPPIDTQVILGHVARLQCRSSHASSIPVQTIWYYDSNAINSESSPRTTILKDGTLEIQEVRAADVGHYTCFVISRGGNDTRSAELKVIELPYPPTAVMAEKFRAIPKTVRIKWTPTFDGNSPLLKYVIQKRQVPTSGPITDLGLNWITVLTNISADAASAIVGGLKPSTGYQFRISAVNSVGEGPPSDPSNIVVLPQEAPSGPPHGLVGSPRSSTEIMIQWESPEESDRNGVVLGYIVRYRLWGYKDAQWYYRNITQESQHNYLIGGLIIWKDYEIQVAAYNIKGVGVYSRSIRVKTKEGIPTAPPKNVSAVAISSVIIMVNWKPPDPWMINGINQGYRVQAWKENPNNSTEMPVTFTVPPSHSPDSPESVNMTGLEKFSKYFITVLCFTHPGDGNRSVPTAVTTLEDVPGPVTGLKFQDITDRTVIVSWSSPKQQNGILKGYTLSYMIKDLVQTETIHNLTADTRKLFVDNLKAMTFYTFRVFAWTSVGPGKAVGATIQSGIEPVLPEPPTRLAVSNIQAFSVVLQFTPGFDGNSSITTWSVEAQSSRSSSWELIYEVSDSDAVSFTVKNLVPYSTYSLRLIAHNIVGNSSPSEPSPRFQMLQAEPSHSPSNMTLRAISATELRVRWIPLQQSEWYGAPRGYLISYRPNLCNCSFSKEVVTDITANSYQLTGLEEYTVYEVTMVAVNDVGTSEKSPFMLERTRESVPSMGPNNITANATSSTTVVVQWGKVDDIHQNGIIEGYKVVYIGKNLGPQEKVITSNVTFATTLTKLRKYYQYSVQVLAYTRLGDGVLSMPPVIVHTFEDARTRLGWGHVQRAPVYTTNQRQLPMPPSRPVISHSQVTSNSLTFSWTPGKDGYAPIRYYTVQYTEGQSAWQEIKEKVDYLASSYTAKNLKPFTTYKFRVRATNDIGASEWSEESTEVQTLIAAPSEPPTDIKVIPITRSSVQVEWTPLFPDSWNGDQKNGGYKISYRQISSIPTLFSTQSKETRDTLAQNYILTDLERDTNYEIVVASFNSQGESPSSAPLTVYVGEAVPTGEPRIIQAEAVSSTEIKIIWKPPSEQEQNGEILGYKIFYRSETDPEELEEVEVVGPQARLHDLPYLDMYTNYIITMLCFNPAGDGPKSPPLSIRTLEDLPGPVSNLSFSDITMNSLKVMWNLPFRPNGEILSYLVTYKTAKPDEHYSKQVNQRVSASYLLVQSLEEEVTYEFSVRAMTFDCGPEVKANVTTGPQIGSPARPRDLTITKTVSSITLHWRNGHAGRSPILGYYIEARKTDSDKWNVLMKTETGTMEEYTISYQNLLPSTHYLFRLIAYNEFGISYPAESGERVVTPSKVFLEYGFLQQRPFYHQTWFMVTLAAISVVFIIIIIAALCVKSKSYKYKRVVDGLLTAHDAANKTMEESLDDTNFSAFEMHPVHRGTASKKSTMGRSTSNHSLGGGAMAIMSSKSPPRPAPASVTYSDDETIKDYDENPDDSSDVTEKPTDISSTDSQGTESDNESVQPDAHSFVNHYANVNDTLRQSWRRQKPSVQNYSSYTDSEAEGSAVMSLNGGHIIMNNMAGSRAPLPGFSSFV